jgi:hypothetical protein
MSPVTLLSLPIMATILWIAWLFAGALLDACDAHEEHGIESTGRTGVRLPREEVRHALAPCPVRRRGRAAGHVGRPRGRR